MAIGPVVRIGPEGGPEALEAARLAVTASLAEAARASRQAIGRAEES
jgi:hypothetical protein